MQILCTVDIRTRELYLEDVTIAAFDHLVDDVLFVIEPIDGFQLETSTIKIAAVGPLGEPHDYEIDPSTVTVDEETGNINFVWSIPVGVTAMPLTAFKISDTKNITFAVCAEIVSGDNLVKAWHSDDGAIKVKAHLEPESGGGENPSEEATNAQKIGQLQTAIAILQREISGIASGTPPTADSTDDMDHEVSAVYINTTDGKWYYWDGTAFQPGGTYGGAVTSTTFNQHGVPADDFAVGEALAGKADTDDLTAIDERVTAVEGEIPDISVVDGRLVIDGTSYEIGGVGIASITKTGTAGLVDTYTILMTDGTSTTFTVTNGDASDAKIQGFIEEWLEEHPEATTTVQDGAITFAKLAPEVTQKLSDVKLTYKWVANGYMREHIRAFQGWAQNVVYDPDLECAVGIINSGIASHEHAQPWYRVTIDNSGYMSQYEEIAVYDTDGETAFDPNNGYMGFTIRLSDGTYFCIDQKQNIYESTDKLKTLVKQGSFAFTQSQDGSMFGGRQLSNGRIIVGHGGWVNGFWYSDDGGTTWTNVIPSASNLGNMIYPERQYTPFEPCFIEIGNGKVLAIARKSMNANASANNAYSAKEPAVFSVSEDYGATWTAWQNSSVITDMTVNNAKACVINGIVHLVYGSRYSNVAAGQNFQLFYTYASLDDALTDGWAEPVVIEHGHWDASTATNPHDSGYPSLWSDKNENLYAVYYDSDGSASEFGANWRLCTGAPVAKMPAVRNDGSGSMSVGYSQKAVDKKTNALWAKINEILLLIGENPGDDGEYDGRAPIYDGLLAWFDVTQTSKWSDSVLTGMVGENTITCVKCNNQGAYISAQIPTAYNNGFMNQPSLFLRDTLAEIGVTGAFTIEAVQWSDSSETMFMLKAANTFNQSTGNNATLYSRSRNINGSKSGVRHFVGVFTSGSVDWYVDGVLTLADTISLSLSEILAAYPLFYTNAHYHSDVRIYNKVLSADEIQNNYLYTQNETDYSTAPVFTAE